MELLTVIMLGLSSQSTSAFNDNLLLVTPRLNIASNWSKHQLPPLSSQAVCGGFMVYHILAMHGYAAKFHTP